MPRRPGLCPNRFRGVGIAVLRHDPSSGAPHFGITALGSTAYVEPERIPLMMNLVRGQVPVKMRNFNHLRDTASCVTTHVNARLTIIPSRASSRLGQPMGRWISGRAALPCTTCSKRASSELRPTNQGASSAKSGRALRQSVCRPVLIPVSLRTTTTPRRAAPGADPSPPSGSISRTEMPPRTNDMLWDPVYQS